jgi:hypothetical protein
MPVKNWYLVAFCINGKIVKLVTRRAESNVEALKDAPYEWREFKKDSDGVTLTVTDIPFEVLAMLQNARSIDSASDLS